MWADGEVSAEASNYCIKTKLFFSFSTVLRGVSFPGVTPSTPAKVVQLSLLSTASFFPSHPYINAVFRGTAGLEKR